jgi:two-component system response regulator AtoC
MFGYHWPGNVRQLANTLERAAIFCRGGVITDEDVNMALQRSPADAAAAAQAESPSIGIPPEGSVQLKDALLEYERDLIVSALRHSGGVQTEAAKRLGVTPKNLWNKLQKHGIDPASLDD